MKTFNYGTDRLTVKVALDIAEGRVRGALDAGTRRRIEASARHVQDIVEGERVVYGINTGFGPLCTTHISKEETTRLQRNLLMSHAVGVGDPIAPKLAKLMLITKAHALAKGYSGVRLRTVERIIFFIESDIIPVVPEQGSVGASGDLAPLSHAFLPLLGLGDVFYKGKRENTAHVLGKVGIAPLDLGPKEGLGLINGTQFMLSHGIMITQKLHNCLEQADINGALMVEALKGSVMPFSEEIHRIRPHKGCLHVAHRMTEMLKGSEIVASHHDCDRVQDPYSLRCIPQVHGASRNAWNHLNELIETELNSVTDNPIVFDADHTVSGGNFHGQPIAMVMDYAALAAAELGNIADRRIYLSMEGKSGIPKLLMESAGLDSGFMILQYTTAALVTENKTLCYPASADSVPTSMGQEDHVSMGSISGRKALKVIQNLERIQAIELLAATQGLEFRRPLKTTDVLEACVDHVRKSVDKSEKDKIYTQDIEQCRQIVANGELVNIVDQYITTP
ncbi:histidine ammonia-lyase (plasmid) [Fulvitalea axinellae]|uniref:Histidine ammonia-lyase n=1 Tax=Fulvitalea axinellae TaxID=1182444 RepID=A0AAU9DFT1_9BACT|nr:histidine ammonia-lyase [Fulvitalea axinellae]